MNQYTIQIFFNLAFSCRCRVHFFQINQCHFMRSNAASGCNRITFMSALSSAIFALVFYTDIFHHVKVMLKLWTVQVTIWVLLVECGTKTVGSFPSFSIIGAMSICCRAYHCCRSEKGKCLMTNGALLEDHQFIYFRF